MVWIELIFDTLGYATARILLPLLTFGRVRVERLRSREVGFGWHGLRMGSNGFYVCRADTAGWLGLIPWMIGALIVIGMVRG